jgi:hypothetical protein
MIINFSLQKRIRCNAFSIFLLFVSTRRDFEENQNSLLVDTNNKNIENALHLNKLMKAIPTVAFEKSLWKSIAYMLFDYVVFATSFVATFSLYNNSSDFGCS